MTQSQIQDHSRKSMLYMLTHPVSAYHLSDHVNRYISKLYLDELIYYSNVVGFASLFFTTADREHMNYYLEGAKHYILTPSQHCDEFSMMIRERQMLVWSLNLDPVRRPNNYPMLAFRGFEGLRVGSYSDFIPNNGSRRLASNRNDEAGPRTSTPLPVVPMTPIAQGERTSQFTFLGSGATLQTMRSFPSNPTVQLDPSAPSVQFDPSAPLAQGLNLGGGLNMGSGMNLGANAGLAPRTVQVNPLSQGANLGSGMGLMPNPVQGANLGSGMGLMPNPVQGANLGSGMSLNSVQGANLGSGMSLNSVQGANLGSGVSLNSVQGASLGSGMSLVPNAVQVTNLGSGMGDLELRLDAGLGTLGSGSMSPYNNTI